MEFVVEVGRKGKFAKRGGTQKFFRRRQKAEKFARKQLEKGSAVAIDELTKGSQRPLLVKGVLAPSSPFGNFGRFTTGPPKPQVKRRVRPKDPFDELFGGGGFGI